MERKLEQNQRLWNLFGAISSLRDSRECALFFRDLCTLTELEAMSERWEVARLLDRGIPYRRISERTGSSTTTITRISHWLRHGEGGYRLVLKRTRKSDSAPDRDE